MKKALMIGVSNYNLKYSDLPGCVNDMIEWTALLKNTYRFSNDGIRLLANERATKSNIINRLKWLFAGDNLENVVLFFAGHGARIRRRVYETGVLDNNLDESIVCFPLLNEDIQDHLLFDDELLSIFQASNISENAKVTFIFDSCYSGGMDRLILYNDNAMLPRSIVLPVDIAARSNDQLHTKRIGELNNNSNLRHMIVSAAMDVESAWDAKMEDGKRHGVFSYYATRFLTDHSNMKYTDLMDNVTDKVTKRFPQHPQLLGNKKRFNRAFLN